MILRGGLCYFLVPSTYLLYLLEYLKTKFLATLKFCGSNFRRIRKTNPLGGSVSLLPSQPLIRIIRSCEEIVGKFDSSHRFDYYSQERAVRPKWFTHNSSIMWFERKLSFYSALRRKAKARFARLRASLRIRIQNLTMPQWSAWKKNRKRVCRSKAELAVAGRDRCAFIYLFTSLYASPSFCGWTQVTPIPLNQIWAKHPYSHCNVMS